MQYDAGADPEVVGGMTGVWWWNAQRSRAEPVVPLPFPSRKLSTVAHLTVSCLQLNVLDVRKSQSSCYTFRRRLGVHSPYPPLLRPSVADTGRWAKRATSPFQGSVQYSTVDFRKYIVHFRHDTAVGTGQSQSECQLSD